MRPCGWPFSKTWYWTDDIHYIISLIQWGSNPKFGRRAWMKSHSTLSYALLMSVLIAIYFSWHALLVRKPWNISWAIRILSDINLPATNADWVYEMREGRHVFKRRHKTFEIILYSTLHRLIGSSSVIFVGLSVFGITQMLVIFNLESITPETRKLFNISPKSSLIICQKCWNKRVVIPSSPSPDAL